jgi:hypothetical protein
VRCDITELITTQCAHCRRLPDVPPLDDELGEIAPDRGPGPVFLATYPGVCPECSEDIARDSRIREYSRGRYVHEGCA